MDQLDKHIRRYYKEHSISKEKIQILLRTSATEEQAHTTERLSRFQIGTAAAILLIASGIVGGIFYQQLHIERDGVHKRVLKELALNHTKNLNPEIRSNSYVEIGRGLHRLGFSVRTAATEKTLTDFIPNGGRYCSLQGNLAAQIKLRHRRNGLRATLYITKYSGDLKRVESFHGVYRGLEVFYWKHDNLFYALIEEMPTQKL